MNVDPKAQLGGVPILQVRQFLRENGDYPWRLERLREDFGPAASDVLHALIEAGYAAPAETQEGELYETTVKGRGLARSSAAKPVSRATADAALAGFLERCELVRGDPTYLFTVAKAVLFGSMLTDKPKVSDVDIAIQLVAKEKDAKLHAELMREQIREAARNGRRFSNMVDEIFWPQTRVRMFLKGRSRVIQFSEINDGVLELVETRVIFADEGAAQPHR